MFAGKTGAYPSEAPFRLLASPTNIRLGWKGFPRTNALAYYEKAQLMAVLYHFHLVEVWASSTPRTPSCSTSASPSAPPDTLAGPRHTPLPVPVPDIRLPVLPAAAAVAALAS